jgi:hypothetical protein
MAHLNLNLYEAFTQAGINPDAARRIERELEAALSIRHDTLRAEMQAQQLLTKADGLEIKNEIHALETRLHKSFNELTWKMMAFVLTFNGLSLAVFKYLDKV